MSDKLMSEPVREEVERRREQIAKDKEIRQATVSERMKKIAGVDGAAPGFNTGRFFGEAK